MPERLLIRLHPDGRHSWRRVGDAGASHDGLPAAGVANDAGDVVVLAPAEDILLTEVALAARRRSQLLQALPFATEDQLLGVIEDQHFALSEALPGEPGGMPRHVVAVVARARLRGWLDYLAAAGIRADALIPDSLAIAEGSGVVEAGRAVVRLGPGSALACASDELDDWLRLAAISTTPKLEKVDDGLAALARTLPARLPLNLLVGEFAPAHRQAIAIGRLRKLALLAAAVMVLAVAARVADVVSLRRTAGQLETATVAELQKLLPDRSPEQLRGADVASLLGERMPGRGGGIDGGVIDLLARLAPVLGTGTRIQLRGLEYRSGTLELALRAPDIPALESLRERLAAQTGLGVEFTGSNPGEAGVDGRLRIRGGAP